MAIVAYLPLSRFLTFAGPMGVCRLEFNVPKSFHVYQSVEVYERSGFVLLDYFAEVVSVLILHGAAAWNFDGKLLSNT